MLNLPHTVAVTRNLYCRPTVYKCNIISPQCLNKPHTEKVYARRSLYGARHDFVVYLGASRWCHLWHIQGRERANVCFESGSPLLWMILTSSSFAVWISGTQISPGPGHNISGMSCFHETQFTRFSSEKMNLWKQKKKGNPDGALALFIVSWLLLIT